MKVLCFLILALPALALPSLEEARARLGSDDAEIRKACSLELWLNGQESLPILRKLAQASNPEVRNRAQHVLRRFQMGLTPESPEDLLRLGEALEKAQPENFSEALNNLLAHDEGLSVALILFDRWVQRDFERNKLIIKNSQIITSAILEQRGRWKASLTAKLSPRCRAIIIQQIALDDFPMQANIVAILARKQVKLVYDHLKKIGAKIDSSTAKSFARVALLEKNPHLALTILSENAATAPDLKLVRALAYLEASSGLRSPHYEGNWNQEYQIFKARLQKDHAKVLRLNRAPRLQPFLRYENLLMSAALRLPSKNGNETEVPHDLALLPLHEAFATPPGSPDIEAISANPLVDPIVLARSLTLLGHPILASEILTANDFASSAVGLLWRSNHREKALALAQETFTNFDPDQTAKMRITLSSLYLESGEQEAARKIFEPLIYEIGLKKIYQKKAISIGLQLFPREKLLSLAPHINSEKTYERANVISHFLPYPPKVSVSWYEHFRSEDKLQSPMTLLSKVETLLEENREEARNITSKELSEIQPIRLRSNHAPYQNALFLKLPAVIDIAINIAWYQLSPNDLLTIIKDHSWPEELRQKVLREALLIDPVNPVLHWHHQQMNGQEKLSFLHKLTLGDPSLTLKLGALTGKRETLSLASEIADLRDANAIRCLNILAKSYLQNDQPAEAARLFQAAFCGELSADTRPSTPIPTTLRNLRLYLEARARLTDDPNIKEVWQSRLQAIQAKSAKN